MVKAPLYALLSKPMATVSVVVELDDTVFLWVSPVVKSSLSAADTDRLPQRANAAKRALRVTFFVKSFCFLHNRKSSSMIPTRQLIGSFYFLTG